MTFCDISLRVFNTLRCKFKILWIVPANFFVSRIINVLLSMKSDAEGEKARRSNVTSHVLFKADVLEYFKPHQELKSLVKIEIRDFYVYYLGSYVFRIWYSMNWNLIRDVHFHLYKSFFSKLNPEPLLASQFLELRVKLTVKQTGKVNSTLARSKIQQSKRNFFTSTWILQISNYLLQGYYFVFPLF